MKHRNLFAVLMVLLVGSLGNIFAQAMGSLTVITNTQEAEVLLDGKLMGIANPNLRVQVKPGEYVLQVLSKGYEDFKQRVSISAGYTTIEAKLKPYGAFQPIGGFSSGPRTLQAPSTLNQAFKVSFFTRTPNAEIFLEGKPLGKFPLSIELARGEYKVLVRAPGYQDHVEVITITAQSSYNFILKGFTAKLQLSIPSHYLSSQRNALSSIVLYIDGVRQSGHTVELEAGSRRIKIESGGLAFEQLLQVEAGKVYTIEPYLSINIR